MFILLNCTLLNAPLKQRLTLALILLSYSEIPSLPLPLAVHYIQISNLRGLLSEGYGPPSKQILAKLRKSMSAKEKAYARRDIDASYHIGLETHPIKIGTGAMNVDVVT